MRDNLVDQNILEFSYILSENKAESKVILEAMEFICKGTSFEYALLYEQNASKEFCLIEHFSSNSIDFEKHCFKKEMFFLIHKELFQKRIIYSERKKENSDFKKQLLDLFGAESLVFAPILDEEKDPLGILVLLNKTSKEQSLEIKKKTLSAMVFSLIRYVSIRIYKRKLEQTGMTLESVLDNTGIDIYVCDFDTYEVLYVNKLMAAPYGGSKQFVGKKCWQVLYKGQNGPCAFCKRDKLIDENGEPTKVYTWDYERPFDGSWFRVFSSAFRWVDGRLVHLVSSDEITENKRNEILIEKLANYDPLTGLPNRRMLVKECERRIGKSTGKEQGYVLFFDIDGFKAINDNLGHDAGDEFLIQLGKFFSEIPLLKEAIYRNGGDGFVAVFGGELVTKEDIQCLTNFILERFKKPWKLKKGDITCNTSIGVACYPEDGVTAETLLQKADMAMYQIKKNGGGGLCFGYELKEKP